MKSQITQTWTGGLDLIDRTIFQGAYSCQCHLEVSSISYNHHTQPSSDQDASFMLNNEQGLYMEKERNEMFWSCMWVYTNRISSIGTVVLNPFLWRIAFQYSSSFTPKVVMVFLCGQIISSLDCNIIDFLF